MHARKETSGDPTVDCPFLQSDIPTRVVEPLEIDRLLLEPLQVLFPGPGVPLLGFPRRTGILPEGGDKIRRCRVLVQGLVEECQVFEAPPRLGFTNRKRRDEHDTVHLQHAQRIVAEDEVGRMGESRDAAGRELK